MTNNLIVRRRQDYRTSRNESHSFQSIVLLINSDGYGSKLYNCGTMIFKAHYWFNTAGEKSLAWYKRPLAFTGPIIIDKDYSENVDDFYRRLSVEYPDVLQYLLFHPGDLFGSQ